MKKIILAGASLNSGNKGINALTQGQIALINNMYGNNVEIEILSNTIDYEVNNCLEINGIKINIKEIPTGGNKKILESYIKSKIGLENSLIKEIKSADMIWDISEGDSFSDIYGTKRFIKHSLLKLTAINLKKKLIVMPQTLGPFKRSWVKSIAKRVISNADTVFVRDELSKEIVTNELNIKRDIIYIPDMAFYMKPNKNISIDKFIKDSDKVKVGLNVNALLYSGGYNGKNMFGFKVDYADLIDSIIEKIVKLENVELILIPHVITKEFEVEDDLRVCSNIAANLSRKFNCNIKSLDREYREDEIKSIIGGCDFFIGSRMHSCIGAISTKVPTVPIAYSRKFIGVWEKLKLGYCVTDPRKQSKEEILNKVLELYSKRTEIKNTLEKEIPLLEKKIEGIIPIIEG